MNNDQFGATFTIHYLMHKLIDIWVENAKKHNKRLNNVVEEAIDTKNAFLKLLLMNQSIKIRNNQQELWL